MSFLNRGLIWSARPPSAVCLLGQSLVADRGDSAADVCMGMVVYKTAFSMLV